MLNKLSELFNRFEDYVYELSVQIFWYTNTIKGIIMSEIQFQEQQRRFELFTNELEKISKKYGVTLDVTGGVNVYNENDMKEIVSVQYDNDSSSGDLQSYIEWGNK